MKIVHISDTHGNHKQLTLPDGDVLIHSGDFSQYGINLETQAFLDWFASQPHRHKILIGGNHDHYLFELLGQEHLEPALSEIHYLCDSQVEIDDVSFTDRLGRPQNLVDRFHIYPMTVICSGHKSQAISMC